MVRRGRVGTCVRGSRGRLVTVLPRLPTSQINPTPQKERADIKEVMNRERLELERKIDAWG